MTYAQLLEEIKQSLAASNEIETALKVICEKINTGLDHYDWVGFYFMDHSNQKLHLGPYVGAPTDHTVIDFGKGICGQVAISGETYFAADVNAESNYIACSIDVKSEIVVPLYQGEMLIGQIDIDSHRVDRFQKEDESFLKEVNRLISERFTSLEEYVEQLK